jgi:hypothetical protein
VLKYVLDRPINWFDVAFFDPPLFESLRSLATHERLAFEDLNLTFSINVPDEEVGVKIIPFTCESFRSQIIGFFFDIL